MNKLLILILTLASFSPYSTAQVGEYYYEMDSNNLEIYEPQDPGPNFYDEEYFYTKQVNFQDDQGRNIFYYAQTTLIESRYDLFDNERHYKVVILTVSKIEILNLYGNNDSIAFNEIKTYPTVNEYEFSINHNYYSYFNEKETYKYTIPNYTGGNTVAIQDSIDFITDPENSLHDRDTEYSNTFNDCITDNPPGYGITEKIRQNTTQITYLDNTASQKEFGTNQIGNSYYAMSSINLQADINANDYPYVYIKAEDFLEFSCYTGDIESYITTTEPKIEVVDIPGLMFTILGMPFAWISTAFNLTLFPGTIYQVNLANIFFMIIGALVLMWIIKKLVK